MKAFSDKIYKLVKRGASKAAAESGDEESEEEDAAEEVGTNVSSPNSPKID